MTSTVHRDDPGFPTLHPGRPTRGWVNDPHGLVVVEGRYHVFFQHNPDAPVHDAITWGHVSSTDLVTWHEEPVALRPQPGAPDSYGCWTGCAVLDDGVPTLVYSGVSDYSGASTVLLARADPTAADAGLPVWQQDPTPVVGMPEDLLVTDVRDPFLFELEGRRYAVQGAGTPTGRPSLLVYDAAELTSWRLLGTLLDGADPEVAAVAPAHIWECPNLVRLGETWLLVISLWSRAEGRDELSGVRWLTGELGLVEGVPRFAPAASGRLDAGPCFYAPQLLADGERVLLWAWSWERDRTEEQVAQAGWAGTLTFPRELALVAGRVVSRPVPELTRLRRESLPPGAVLPPAYDVELGAGPGELWLEHADGSEELVAAWRVPAEPVTEPRLLVDGSVVEVFPGTPESLTTRGYPRAGSRWRLVGERLGAWTLGLPPGP